MARRAEKFNQMSGGFKYLEGGPFQRPDDIIIDRFYAAQKKLKAGDTLNLLSHDWHVAGVIEGGKLARIVMPLSKLQELTANTGKFSQVYLKLDDPASTPAVIEALKAKFEDYPIYSMDELTSRLVSSTCPVTQAASAIWTSHRASVSMLPIIPIVLLSPPFETARARQACRRRERRSGSI